MDWIKRGKEKLENEKRQKETMRRKVQAFQESGILEKIEKKKDDGFLLSLLAMFHRIIG